MKLPIEDIVAYLPNLNSANKEVEKEDLRLFFFD